MLDIRVLMLTNSFLGHTLLGKDWTIHKRGRGVIPTIRLTVNQFSNIVPHSVFTNQG